MATFISFRTTQFTYFDAQLGSLDWTGRKVLDFGGNAGNMLRDQNVKIKPEDYWCIEILRGALAEGRRLHPRAHFIHYDRYNFEYNPTGTVGLPIPDPGERFDVIVSFSVFTHTSQAEMLEHVTRLRSFLAPGGVLAFTFLDPNWVAPPGWAPAWTGGADGVQRSNLHHYLEVNPYVERRLAENPDLKIDVAGMLARAAATELTYVTVVNDDELYLDPDADGVAPDKPNLRYLTFCTAEHMQRLFPDAEIRPPILGERQHCAVLRTA